MKIWLSYSLEKRIFHSLDDFVLLRRRKRDNTILLCKRKIDDRSINNHLTLESSLVKVVVFCASDLGEGSGKVTRKRL